MAETKGKKITISPVTRIEGHARITLQYDAKGKLDEARFHVNEFRGFEKFCEGRYFTEMPAITPRICGICPVSHAVCSAKAGEGIMRIKPPRIGDQLRRLIQLGQMISSHALSFYHLSSPDMLMGWDCDPDKRNIVGMYEQFPDLVRRGIRLRQFGQEISMYITGKKIHTMGVVCGGMSIPLKEEAREALLKWIPEALETLDMSLELYKGYYEKNKEELNVFAYHPTMYMGLVQADGTHEFYDGKVRLVDEKGEIVEDGFNPADFAQYIAEHPIAWSYLKYPYYKPYGFEKGFYRVGPLARLNVAERMPTPLAQKEFELFRQLEDGKVIHGTFHFHYARLIEMLSSVEQARDILNDPQILSTETWARGERNQHDGVGCTEAPRGILFHHYTTDDNGLLTKVNLLIATGQNNPAMNTSIKQVAEKYVRLDDVQEGALNRVEGAIRCYDPCLSCSTHAAGQMPLLIELKDHRGKIVRTLARGG
ncbi:MAG: Ni/Fe hydrogenase subunit alpha [Candidatus Omnitrophica bacterium]|nr:Ni/Fe hydrogenase subunit alpha [Candidatus Omnitrophota bacterium]